jgi:large subunit ribosomal protein L23
MSEKAYAQANTLNTYVFNVPLDANKIQIKAAVEKEYSVNVNTVNIVRQDGKTKQAYRKRGGRIQGKRKDFKKAYVVLAEGQSIPVFTALEEGEDK